MVEILNRISETFTELKRDGRKGFIPFITAGDPNLQTTGKLILELARVGAAVIELGIPFTDPMADGPVIQRASERALRHSFGISDVLEVVSHVRKQSDVPIILFSYFNPLLQFGGDETVGSTSPPPKQIKNRLDAGLVRPSENLERLAVDAAAAGIDGILVTDLVPEEASDFAALLKANGLDMIFLVAPTSTDDRLKMVAERASGFIYAVSRAGITGAREQMTGEAEKLVQRMRHFSDLPIAVGFGISKAEHVTDVWRYADAAVVGSAIVDLIDKSQDSPDLVHEVGRFSLELMSHS